jgi:hypothetical protein
MMSQQNVLAGGTGGVSKVTPQAAIIINSAVDAYDVTMRQRSSEKTIYDNKAEENFAVMRGELVFANSNKPPSGSTMGKNNPSVTVTSSLNGQRMDADLYNRFQSGASDESARRAALREVSKGVKFVGIAQGEKSKRDFENRSLSLAIRVAGSDTIYNSGHTTIQPGDDVMWDVPDPTKTYPVRSGQPKSKNILVVQKHNYCDRQLSDDIALMGKKIGDSGSSDESKVKGSIKEFLKQMGINEEALVNRVFDKRASAHGAFMNMLKHIMMYKAATYDSRVIGKALSQGEPGKSFDILLNHTHVQS